MFPPFPVDDFNIYQYSSPDFSISGDSKRPSGRPKMAPIMQIPWRKHKL